MSRKLMSSGSSFEELIAYSRAVVQRDWVFVSGTTGFDDASMTISPQVDEQARQCFENIQTALQEAGASLADGVRIHYQASWPAGLATSQSTRPAISVSARGVETRIQSP